MKKKEIIDSIVEVEATTEATLQTISTLKEEIAKLLEENQTLQMENAHLRERLSKESQPLTEEETSGLTKSRLNLENIYEDGFHVCNIFMGNVEWKTNPVLFV